MLTSNTFAFCKKEQVEKISLKETMFRVFFTTIFISCAEIKLKSVYVQIYMYIIHDYNVLVCKENYNHVY